MIINKTPHPVTIITESGTVILASVGAVRLATKTVACDPIDGIATSKTEFGSPEGLPEFQVGTYYIVSQLIRSACPDRVDLLVPAEVVRDKQGNILGCKSLGR